MAPTAPHILMTAHGTLPGGEAWTCGLRSAGTESFLSSASGNALALAVANRWRVFQNTATDCLGNDAIAKGTFDGVTMRELNDTGVTVTQYEGVPSTALAGSGSKAVSLPDQCAVVVTLLTNRAGRTGKGRIYLPFIAPSALSIVGGVLITGVVTTLMTNLKILFDGINTDLTTNFGSSLKIAVQSPKSAALDSGYTGSIVTAFKVGNVVDTQRRRRGSIPEVYQQLSVN